jgi:hypothetical protein
METFSFDVSMSSHDLLREGVVARPVCCGRDWHRIVVMDTDVVSAHLVAAQMAACHGMVTEISLRV